jgi:RNA polymerase sigma factor (sigma-70 family)
MDSKNNSTDDLVLWEGVRAGNPVSFEKLYNSYFGLLYNYGRKVCSNPTILDDAIHDLFLDIWRYRSTLSATTSIRFYLYRALRRRIFKNEAKDIETSVFDFHLEEVFLRKTFSHEDNLIEGELCDERTGRLKKHLNNLSPRQYEALVLRFYDDFSYEEIAALLEVNEQSARNLVQRGLEQLRTFAKILSSLILLAAYL